MAQYAKKKISSSHQEYTDSLKNIEYKYIFPIWGQGAYHKGFDIPYPAGIIANFMWLKQGVLIDNLQLGFYNDNRDIPLTSIDFVEFSDNINTAWTANTRIDLWLFHFLDVYGIFGAQFQLNKQWMFRTEAGLIGDQKSIRGSINYRFLI